MKTATIFNIQRFSIHDGPGIRTVVFFKGCPLHCLWCANPESQERNVELELLPANCVGCGSCLKACLNNAIFFDDSGIHVDRTKCTLCGKCSKECYSKTLKMVGERKTVDEIVAEIAKDEVFYRNSGGGITLSGGEPLMHGEFCIDLLDACKYLNCHTAIETCGYGDKIIMKELAKRLSLMFIDIKHMDSKIHKSLTGVSNEKIHENLRSIQKYAKEIIIRTPVMSGINDTIENVKATAEFCRELDAVERWELLPYHNLGEHKYEAIGRCHKEFVKPDKDQMQRMLECANKILLPVGKECKIEGSGMA